MPMRFEAEKPCIRIFAECSKGELGKLPPGLVDEAVGAVDESEVRVDPTVEGSSAMVGHSRSSASRKATKCRSPLPAGIAGGRKSLVFLPDRPRLDTVANVARSCRNRHPRR